MVIITVISFVLACILFVWSESFNGKGPSAAAQGQVIGGIAAICAIIAVLNSVFWIGRHFPL